MSLDRREYFKIEGSFDGIKWYGTEMLTLFSTRASVEEARKEVTKVKETNPLYHYRIVKQIYTAEIVEVFEP